MGGNDGRRSVPDGDRRRDGEREGRHLRPGRQPVRFRRRNLRAEAPPPRVGRAGLDEWWMCLVATTKRAMSESGVSPEEDAGISLDTTASTVLAMDEKDRHMRQAILWMDVRASDQARIDGQGFFGA